jgi:NitT/TauT family transport system ATP-binding protein
MGKSGMGKTTLLRLMAGLLLPDSGSVMYGFDKLKKPVPDIFMMHQNYANFPWKTCLENVVLPIKLRTKVTNEKKGNAIEILRGVGLGEYINRYPYELSGGMNQRLALARTLIMRPKVLLMDEPLSALDGNTRAEMQNMIKKFQAESGSLIIMVTHDRHEAEVMAEPQNCYFLQDGELV